MRLPRSHALRSARCALAFVVTLAATAAFAGAPLICHPYLIGADAKTLPGGTDGFGVSQSYDRTHLVRDTLALLTPETPILVRMETLRRAALYSTKLQGWETQHAAADRELARTLLDQLRKRMTASNDKSARALALFDAGFLAETLRQANLDLGLDGYALLRQAAELRGPDPEVEFALALASVRTRGADYRHHLAKARSLAPADSLVANNLATHFGKS